MRQSSNGEGFYSQEDISRFWSKVNICGKDECWEWKTGCFDTGYGAFHPLVKPPSGIMRRKVMGAHRFSMELKLGRKLRKGEWTLHHCDNPKCVNPDHLYVGDQQANTDDRQRRKRESRGKKHSLAIKRSPGIIAMRGEGNYESKFTDEIVLEMRRLFDNKIMNRNQIAEKFGGHGKTISGIVFRQSWRHLP